MTSHIYKRSDSVDEGSDEERNDDGTTVVMNPTDPGSQVRQAEQAVNIQNILPGQVASTEPLSPFECKYVKTRAYAAVKEVLEDMGRVLVCGSPGSGKTTTSLVLQQKYRHRKYTVLCPRNIRDFNLEAHITTSSKIFLVLDDLFGRFAVNMSEIAQCFLVLDDIQHHYQRLQRLEKNASESFRVLITSRTDVYLDMEARLKRYKPFLLRPVCVINLTLDGENKLSSDERKEILIAHLEQSSLTMSDKEISIISESDYTTLGFPYICKLFVSRKTSSINPIDFFLKPMDFLDEEISEMFLNKDRILKAAVLLLLVLNDGSFNLADLTVSQSTASLDLQKVKEILTLPDTESLPTELNKAAKTMIGTYIICARDVVRFSHPTIYDVVAYVVGTFNPTFVLSNCSLQFIVERMILETDTPVSGRDNPKRHILISESYVKGLLARLIREMKNGQIAMSLSHTALLQQDVFQMLICELKSKELLEAVTHTRDDGYSFFFWACYTGVWKRGLLRGLGKLNITDEEYLEAYLSACITGNLEAFNELTDIIGTLNGQISTTTLGDIAHGTEERMLTNNLKLNKDEVVVSKRHDRNQDHLIHIASENGHVDIVELLIEMGTEVNDRGGMGMTALMYGCFFGHCNLVKMLLHREADTELKNDDGDNCLHLAARGGFKEIMELLLKKMNPNCRGRFDRTPLMYAAYDGHRDVVELLIRHGADLQPEGTEINSHNCLHEACVTGHLDIVRLLLETWHMDIERKGEKGRTPLLVACRWARLETVQYLVSKEAVVEARDRNGSDCIHLAAISGDIATVKWLLDGERFDLESRNYWNQTPLMSCVFNQHIELFNFLLSRNADVNAQDNTGQTCLQLVAFNGNLDIAKILVKKCLRLDVPGVKGRTPVMVACMSGHEEMFTFFKQNNADLTLADTNENSCLHLASLGANINIVQSLLDMDLFDINKTNKYGYTPLTAAVKSDSPDIIDLLYHNGATLDRGLLQLARRNKCQRALEKLQQLFSRVPVTQ